MLKRGKEPITRVQAVRFLEDRKHLHLAAATEIRHSGDIEGNEIDKLKYDNSMQLALIYGDIADMLETIETLS